MKRRMAVIGVALTCLGFMAGIATAYYQDKPQAQQMRPPKKVLSKEEAAFAPPASLTTKPPGKGQKLCSVFAPSNWRDTIDVPATATLPSCIRFMNITAATTLQLGCIFADGSVSLGTPGGGAPSPNCGW